MVPINSRSRFVDYYHEQGFASLMRVLLQSLVRRAQFRLRALRFRQLIERNRGGVLLAQTADGFALLLPANPRDGIVVSLGTIGVHEPGFKELVSSELREGMVVVNVGAHIGYYALLASRRVGPNGRVIAVEPAPETFSILLENVRLNSAQNILCLNAAVGDCPGKKTLYMSAQADCNSLFEHPGCVSAIEVDVLTLDDLLESEAKVDIVIMDIEGYEARAIDGFSRTLERFHPLLLMELHTSLLSPADVANLFRKLAQAKYEIKWALSKADSDWGRSRRGNEIGSSRIAISTFQRNPRLAALREIFFVAFAPAGGWRG